jgi:hypothetical protein
MSYFINFNAILQALFSRVKVVWSMISEASCEIMGLGVPRRHGSVQSTGEFSCRVWNSCLVHMKIDFQPVGLSFCFKGMFHACKCVPTCGMMLAYLLYVQGPGLSYLHVWGINLLTSLYRNVCLYNGWDCVIIS